MKTILFGSNETFFVVESLEICCFVLEDYTRVISKNSLDKIFGLESKNGTGMYNFFLEMSTKTPIDLDFLELIKTPIAIQSKDKSQIILAFESDFLITFCQQALLLQNLKNSQRNVSKIIKKAKKIILFFENKTSIRQIDQVTGFNYFKQKAKESLRNYLFTVQSNPAFDWVITFSDTFYETVFLFMNSSWFELKKKPNKIADFFYSIIFLRIDDKILIDLETTKPKRTYSNKNGILLNREHKELQYYNQTLQEFFVQSNFERSEFMQLIIKNYPKNTTRANLLFEELEQDDLTFFNEKLKIGLSIIK